MKCTKKHNFLNQLKYLSLIIASKNVFKIKFVTVFSLSFLLIFSSLNVNAKVKLPRLISDGMILQRNETIHLWGWANPGERVKIEFLGKTVTSKAKKDGKWQIDWLPIEAGGPYAMKINEIEISNILVGDVWLCSGQSNMELQIRRVMDLYADEIMKINNTSIRLFRCSSRNDFDTPQENYIDGEWKPATLDNVMEFPALAYFFADQIAKNQNVPVGIISTAIGGSPIESWISNSNNAKYLDQWLARKLKLDSLQAANKGNETEPPFNFMSELNKMDKGIGRWSREDVDAKDWASISVPGYWLEQDVDLTMGSMWYYKEFFVPDSLIGKDAILRLGRIIDSDLAFVNGHFVGTISYQYPPRIYKVASTVLKPGINKLVVRIICPGGVGGFVQDKPYELRIGSQAIDLTGDWKCQIGAKITPPKRRAFGGMSFRPGGLFNGLINPVANYRIKGVVWYQGESNTGQGKVYGQMLKTLINDWRTKFEKKTMPFLYVQLSNLGTTPRHITESGWAMVREAQRRTLEMPYTGMAVSHDVGEWNDIHPLNKKEVARRLVLEARRVAYGDTAIVSNGPLYKSMEPKGNSIVLTFESVGSGLYTNSLLDGFQIAGDDGKFVWAQAIVISRNKVKVWSREIANPKTVRYAWQDNPVGANLKNKEGLPASCFSTDVNLFSIE